MTDIEVIARPQSEEEWLALRAKFSNGSTAAVHMREHEWLSIADWFVEKRTGATQAETRAMTRGSWLESRVIEWYCAEHDLAVSPLEVLFRRDKLLVTPDGEFIGRNEGIEVKATRGVRSKRARYWQAVALLAASEWDAVHLVELGGDDYYPTVIRRTDQVEADIERLMKAIESDWSYLDLGMPPPDAVFDADQVFAVWPVPDVAKIDLPDLAVPLARDLNQARADKRDAEAREKKARDALANLMVDGFSSAEVGMWNGEPLISYKANRPSRQLDKALLRRRVPDIVEQCSIEVPGARVLRVVGDTSMEKPVDVGF